MVEIKNYMIAIKRFLRKASVIIFCAQKVHHVIIIGAALPHILSQKKSHQSINNSSCYFNWQIWSFSHIRPTVWRIHLSRFLNWEHFIVGLLSRIQGFIEQKNWKMIIQWPKIWNVIAHFGSVIILGHLIVQYINTHTHTFYRG